MLYLDTNIIAAYYCPEAMSRRVETFLLKQSDRLAISQLTEVELVSAISRKVREKTMTPKDGKRVTAQFEKHLREGFFEKVLLTTLHYQKAKEWLKRFDTALRTLDALHLAVSDCERAPIVSLDKKLLASAQRLHVDFYKISLHTSK